MESNTLVVIHCRSQVWTGRYPGMAGGTLVTYGRTGEKNSSICQWHRHRGDSVPQSHDRHPPFTRRNRERNRVSVALRLPWHARFQHLNLPYLGNRPTSYDSWRSNVTHSAYSTLANIHKKASVAWSFT